MLTLAEQILTNTLLQKKILDNNQIQACINIAQTTKKNYVAILAAKGFVNLQQAQSLLQTIGQYIFQCDFCREQVYLPNTVVGSSVQCPKCKNNMFGNNSSSTMPQPNWNSQETQTPQDLQEPLQNPRLQTTVSEDMFQHYKLEGKLGQGGMGVVYKAFDTRLQRIVALKLVKGSHVTENQIKRFLQEARATAKLKHPNIVSLYEVGEVPQNYFTMEYIKGSSLSTIIKQGKLTPRDSAKIIEKCARAIHIAHENDIVHRDIKPSNIMMEKDKVPKIMDFGLAKTKSNQKLSEKGDMMGTPAYMPPEQADNSNVSARSDIYSLGATLYETLTGRPPFQGESYFKILARIFQDDPIPPRSLNPDIPSDLEAICLKCLEKKADKRYSNAQIMANDLVNFLENRPIVAKPASKITHIKKWMIRNKAITFLISVTIIGTIVFIAAILRANIEKDKALQAEKIAKNKAQKALQAEERAKLAEQKAKNKAIHALKAEEKAKLSEQEAKNMAIRATNKAKKALYVSNMSLAQKYLQDNNFREAENKLESIPKKFRGWEWYWLKRKGTKDFFKIKPHRAYTFGCDYNPRRNAIVSGGRDDYLKIWDFSSKKLLKIKGKQTPGERGNILYNYDCKFSPNGRFVAAVYKIGKQKVCIWDIDKKQKIRIWDTGLPAQRCIFSPDGKYLLCSYKYKSTTKANVLKSMERVKNLILWDIAKNKQVFAINAHAAFSNRIDCDFSPDGKTIVSAGENKIKFWNYNGKLIRTLKKTNVSLARFSPDGNKLIVATENRLQLWNSKTNRWRKFDQEHTKKITICNFSLDGKKIVSAAQDLKIILWDTALGKKVKIFIGHTGKEENPEKTSYLDKWITSCTFIDHNTILSSGADNSIRIWKIKGAENPQTLSKETSSINNIVFHPHGKLFAFSSQYNGVFDFWSTKNKKKLFSIRMPNLARDCVFSPDGTKVLVVGTYFVKDNRATAFLYDIEKYAQPGFKPRKLIEFTGYIGGKFCSAFHPNNRWIVIGGHNRCLFMWDAKIPINHRGVIKRDPIAQFVGMPKKQYGQSYSRKHKAYRKRNKKYNFFQHKYKYTSCSFDITGKVLIATFERMPGVMLWKIANTNNIKGMQFITNFLHHGRKNKTLKDCAISKSNRLIAAGESHDICLWDSKGNKEIIFKGHRGIVTQCLFLANESRIISADSDGIINIWNPKFVDYLKEKISIPLLSLQTPYKNAITALTLSPDGKTLISGDSKGYLVVFSLKNGQNR